MTRAARSLFHLPLLAALAFAGGVAPGWARGGDHSDSDSDRDFRRKRRPAVVELDEAEVFIEWNSTDTDFGIQFFWDSVGFTQMSLFDELGKKVLDVETKRNVRAQGLSEGFFESTEPPASELSMEEFFDRFAEGEYRYRGWSIDGDRLMGETELTHDLLAPPTNLSPAEGDVVSHLGFSASFDVAPISTEGDPLDIEFCELIVEAIEEEPVLQVFSVILLPGTTSVDVPAQFLVPGAEYKLEVVCQEESGNRTITEDGPFTTTTP